MLSLSATSTLDCPAPSAPLLAPSLGTFGALSCFPLLSSFSPHCLFWPHSLCLLLKCSSSWSPALDLLPSYVLLGHLPSPKASVAMCVSGCPPVFPVLLLPRGQHHLDISLQHVAAGVCCALTTCTPDCMLDGGHLIQSVQPCLPAPSPWSGSPWRPRIILSTSERGKLKLRKESERSNSKNSDRLALKPALLPRVVCVKLQQRRDSPQTLIPRTFRPSPCPRGHQSRSTSALCPTPSFLALAHQGRRKGWCHNGQRQLLA